MCAEKFPLVSMGGRAEGLACADPGVRTPIGASGNLPTVYLTDSVCPIQTLLFTIKMTLHFSSLFILKSDSKYVFYSLCLWWVDHGLPGCWVGVESYLSGHQAEHLIYEAAFIFLANFK